MERKLKKTRATRQAKVPKTASPTKKKRVLKPRVEKTRNNGTMSELGFFNFLRQLLRRASMLYWKPIAQARKDAQVPYKGTNTKRKYSYVCSKCLKEYSGAEIAVHHRVECGSLMCFEDLPGFVERLFCEKQFLDVLCNDCHNKIHHNK